MSEHFEQPGDGFDDIREKLAAALQLDEGVAAPSGLSTSVDAALAAERGVGAWLSSRSTGLRFALATLAVLLAGAAGAIKLRVDAGAYPQIRLMIELCVPLVLALLAIGIPTLLQPPPAPELPPVYSLVLRDSAQQPLWMVVCDWRTHQFTVNRVAAAAPDAEKSHELWLVRKDDAAPLSLGLLQGDELHGALPDNANWRGTKALAVSLEPAGGSPTGLPTGPVLYVAPTPI